MNKLILLTIILFVTSGCSTLQGPSYTNNMQIKVAQLERKLSEKDKKVADLEYEVERLSSELEMANSLALSNIEEPYRAEVAYSNTSASSKPTKSKTSKEDTRIIRVNASEKDVQKALKNAGFYTGAIDGKIGSGSKQAIKDFQKEKGLTSDGIIGQRTWTKLKTYLN